MAFALTFALLILNGVLSYRNTSAVAAREQRVAYSREVLDVLQSILSALTDAETGMRGYLITGAPSYLQPYDAGSQRVEKAIQRLQTLTPDNPFIQQRIPVLESRAGAALHTMAEAVAVRKAAGFEAAQRLVLTGRGKKEMDGLRQLIAGMKQAEEDRLQGRAELSRVTTQTALGILSATTALGVACVALCCYLVHHHLRLRKEAEEDLKRADQHKNEFLAVLAHELRNPLASLRNVAQIVRLGPADGPMAQQALNLMERQVAYMNRLIDDLLDVARISQGKIQLCKEPLDLSVAVQSAVESNRPLINARRHEVSLSLPAQPVRVDADPARLAQVLTNLLTNAAKYTEERGQIWLTVERAGSEAVVRVRDTGIGIPAEMLPRIFDLFMQVAGSLERSQGGLGIGLNLVRRLVELHGGRVEARSGGPGRGSEFSVHLPALPETEAMPRAKGRVRARPVQAG